jgi:Tol biopolymer transport system component
MDRNAENADEVFVALGTGGAEPTRVSGAFVTDEQAFNVQWAPDGTHLAYFADPDVTGQFEMFVAVPDVPDNAFKVSGVLDANEEVFQFAWSPDGTRLLLVASLETAGVAEAFVASITGGVEPVKISGTLTAGGGVSSSTTGFGFSPLGNP